MAAAATPVYPFRGPRAEEAGGAASQFHVQDRELGPRALTTLREKLIKIGAKVVRHAKYVTLQMGDTVLCRRKRYG